MLPELGMDWLVEVTTERYYGPTTLGAIQEFMHLGEIGSDTFVINSCDGVRKRISEMSLVLPPPIAEEGAAEALPLEDSVAPVATGMSIDIQDRIRDLEQSLREERRALLEAEERYRALELKYQDLQRTSR